MMNTKGEGCCSACGAVGRQPVTVQTVGAAPPPETQLLTPQVVRTQGVNAQRPVYIWGRVIECDLQDDDWLGQGGSDPEIPLLPGQYIVSLYNTATDETAGTGLAWIRQGPRNAGALASAETNTSPWPQGPLPRGNNLQVPDLYEGDVAEFTVTDASNCYLTAIGNLGTLILRVRRVDSAER